jgi:hypothetical protein
MCEPGRERRIRFRLRTLLISVVLLSIPLGWAGYSLAWIRERERRIDGWSFGQPLRPKRATDLDWWVISDPFMHLPGPFENRELPLSLRVWREEAHYQLNYLGPAERFEEAQRLFPEALILNSSDAVHF